MSLLGKALKKAQESRKNIVYLTDAPQSWPRTALMGLLILSSLAALLMGMAAIRMVTKNSELKQTQLSGLEKIIKSQEKRIHDLTIAVNRDQKFTDRQIEDLNQRFKSQINNLTSTENDHYSNLKDAILDDKEEISLIDKYAKNLDQKITKFSSAESQTTGLTTPAAGN